MPHTHDSPFRRASKEGLIRKDRSVHVVVRVALHDQKDLIDDRGPGFTIVSRRDFDRIGIGLGLDRILERVRERVGDATLHASVNIDVLDPAHAPGTGGNTGGGWNDQPGTAGVVRGLRHNKIVEADIAEVASAYGHAILTSVAAANLAREFISIMAEQKTTLPTASN